MPKLAALKEAKANREAEIFNYDLNIDNFVATIATIDVEIKSIADPEMKAEMQRYRDRLDTLLKEHKIERMKVDLLAKGMQSQIDVLENKDS